MIKLNSDKFKSRRERRERAKEEGVSFEPKYNGSEPIPYKEWQKLNEELKSKHVRGKQKD